MVFAPLLLCLQQVRAEPKSRKMRGDVFRGAHSRRSLMKGSHRCLLPLFLDGLMLIPPTYVWNVCITRWSRTRPKYGSGEWPLGPGGPLDPHPRAVRRTAQAKLPPRPRSSARNPKPGTDLSLRRSAVACGRTCTGRYSMGLC